MLFDCECVPMTTSYAPRAHCLLRNASYASRIGGGCTPFQCGLEVLYHASMSSDLQQMELVDFQAQQLARPWRVPTRSRQAVLDDACAWWFAWPHACKGRQCLQMTGVSNALPRMTLSSSLSVDGVYSRAEFALSAVEDPLINKAARHFWDANNMCQARADALADVQADFDAGKLKSAQDVFQYLEDESEPENELFEGIEAAVVSDSDDENR